MERTGSPRLISQLLFLHFILVASSIGVDSCAKGCNCSKEKIALLGDKTFFVVDCIGNSIDVSNLSIADVFYYEAPADPGSVFDSNILHNFYNLKWLSIDGGLQGLNNIPTIGTLKFLQVTNTLITFLSKNVIADISSNLILLSLPYNVIDYVSENSFDRLPNLRYLNLSHNELMKIPSASLKSLKSLESLDLSFNLIRSLSSSDFLELESLKWLSLDANDVYSLAFINFPNSVMSFLIRNNPLTNFSWHGTVEANIQLLDISGNRLTIIESKTFADASIETLKLTDCDHLQMVDAYAFTNSTLTKIMLSNNSKLRFIDPDAFQNCHKLASIDVSYSKLTVLPKEWSQLPAVEQILAQGNPLACDCNIRWIIEVDSSARRKVTFSPSAPGSECSVDESITQQCQPQVTYRSSNVTTVDEGVKAILRCKVSGIPTPTVQWLYGNRVIPSDSNIAIVNNDLLISQTKSINSGIYQCLAKNNRGPVVREKFYFVVTKDDSKIRILNIGKDFVEFSWKIFSQNRRYKAILIDVRNNNQTSYDIKQFARSRYSPSGYTISELQSDTTYRVCLAYQSQQTADSEKCDTFTTKKATEETPNGITDYTLYGIIVAAIVSFIFVCIIVCVCITSRNYSNRKRKEVREGRSESTYALMTTSFSQRSGMSGLYDNPGVSITPVSHLSRTNSRYVVKRSATSAVHTPTSPAVYFSPNVIQYDEATGTVIRTLKRTVSDPLLSMSTQHY